MLSFLAQRWWVLLLRGIAAVGFGLLAIVRPDIGLATLVILFGITALMDGISGVVLGFGGRAGGTWWQMVLLGLAGVAAGIVAFVKPGLTAVALVYLIAFWSMARGIFEILAAIRLRKLIEHEWLLGLSGALAVIFGVLLLRQPGVGALTLVLLIGAYMIALGLISIVFSFRVKSLGAAAARA